MKTTNKRNRLLLTGALSGLLLTGASGAVSAATHITGAKGDFDKHSVLVKFKDQAGPGERKNLARAINATFKDRNNDGVDDRFANIGKGRLAQLELAKGQQVDQILKRLANHPMIEFAEPNYMVYATATPNDTQYSSLWGMSMISAPTAWDSTIGDPSIVVGVIDTGFDYNHPDLNANIWRNPNEIAGNGIDDDGNGYVDDVHGISAINDNGDPMDTDEHGTHVAGTIGATGNNAEGVVGVNWQTSMVGCSFLGASGGTTADGIQCIDYMVALKNSGINIRVLNNSWGGGGFSQALKDAITAANAVDILFVAAAGNNSADTDSGSHYPSNYDVANVMSIASTTSTDSLSSFSNYGATTVDMGAPGSSILSTVPGNAYSSFNGTSMATPHVAGAAALMLAANPALTTAEVKQFLMDSGDAIAALSGKTVSGKRLNVAQAITDSGGAGPSFYMAPTPYSVIINQGMSTSYSIDLNGVGGYTGSATLSAVASPAFNGTISFSANPVAAGTSANMVVNTTTDTAPGTYAIAVTAVDGSITKTANVTLKVWPDGTVTTSYSSNTPVVIPDNDPTGAQSVINVPNAITLTEVSASVDISHTYIGDLVVTLTSPSGVSDVLHDRAGGSADDLIATFTSSAFELENALGNWTLSVVDKARADTGAINSWTLQLTGAPTTGTDFAPNVSIASPTNNGGYLLGEAIIFNASANDTEDGDLTANIAWTSSIDGAIGTGGNFTKSDLSVGSHTITASVTDSAGQTQTQSVDLTVAVPNTTVSGSNTTAVTIPEWGGSGVSEIELTDGINIADLEVSVNISFNAINYLKVWLISPSGTRVDLQTTYQSWGQDLIKTYTPTGFNGESTMGVWQLHAEDVTSYTMNGVINSWSIEASN